ncbi:hypothetical protein ABW19_dt0209356 [Dactylella cylindrospora]|nr:hypothetical protein ABW19_dt0209356 [Dactylella cylindrospora]
MKSGSQKSCIKSLPVELHLQILFLLNAADQFTASQALKIWEVLLTSAGDLCRDRYIMPGSCYHAAIHRILCGYYNGPAFFNCRVQDGYVMGYSLRYSGYKSVTGSKFVPIDASCPLLDEFLFSPFETSTVEENNLGLTSSRPSGFHNCLPIQVAPSEELHRIGGLSSVPMPMPTVLVTDASEICRGPRGSTDSTNVTLRNMLQFLAENIAVKFSNGDINSALKEEGIEPILEEGGEEIGLELLFRTDEADYSVIEVRIHKYIV